MGRIPKKKKSGTKKKRPVGKRSAATQVRQAVAAPVNDTKKRSVSAAGKAPPRRPSTSGDKRLGYIDKSMQFLREVIMELKKVTWPSRKQTTGSTIVMIILVAIISLFLGTVDFGLTKLIQSLFTALQ